MDTEGTVEAIPERGVVRRMSGWGRYPVVKSRLLRPEKISELVHYVSSSGSTVLARGAGRSYGDGALNTGGETILMERLNRMLSFDETTGVLTCEGGVTFDEILKVFVPRGYFPGVTPGTRFVTMGGAIAFDVHGKNHHRDGSFSNFVKGFELLLASGQTVHCSRERYSDLFWATVGGMGLTGVITEVDVQLCPIQTAYIRQHSIKAKDLNQMMALFDEHESNYQYSVAWIDCLASGSSLGRGIMMFGNHADPGDLPAYRHSAPFSLPHKFTGSVPFDIPSGVLNRVTASWFNSLYYKKHPAGDVDSVVDYNSFFYPLDGIKNWNRVYGRRGFVQYQCVLPADVSHEALVKLLDMCSTKGVGSFLGVLKRFGPQEGWMPFPMPGYTLALDIPMRRGLLSILEEMDHLVLDFGGRVYLAKDSRLTPASFRQMYTGYDRWLKAKSEIDPDGLFASALSERLELGQP